MGLLNDMKRTQIAFSMFFIFTVENVAVFLVAVIMLHTEY